MSRHAATASFNQFSFNGLRVIGYASGNFAKALQAGIVDIFYLYFLINTVQLPASLAGTVLLAGLIFDGVSDPLVSRLIDRYGHIFKSLSNILLLVIPFNIISFSSLFVLPLYFDAFPFIAALLASLLFRLGYTLVDIPHNALLAGMAKHSKSTIVSAWRFCFSAISVLFLAGLSTFPLFNPQSTETSSADALTWIILGIGVAYVLIIGISALSCRSVILESRANREVQASFFTGLKQLLSNPDYVRLLKIIASICCFLSMAERSTVFQVEFSDNENLNTWELLTAIGSGKLISLFFWVKFASQKGEIKSFQYAHGLCLLAIGALILAYPDLPNMLTISYLILGISIGGVSVFIWSLLAKVVNTNLLCPKLNLSTLAFGIFLLVLKVSSGIGSFILSIVLDIISPYDISTQQSILVSVIVMSVVFAALTNMRVVRKLSANLDK